MKGLLAYLLPNRPRVICSLFVRCRGPGCLATWMFGRFFQGLFVFLLLGTVSPVIAAGQRPDGRGVARALGQRCACYQRSSRISAQRFQRPLPQQSRSQRLRCLQALWEALQGEDVLTALSLCRCRTLRDCTKTRCLLKGGGGSKGWRDSYPCQQLSIFYAISSEVICHLTFLITRKTFKF